MPMKPNQPRYRITIEDRQAGQSRTFESPVVLEVLNTRPVLGTDRTAQDLTLSCRYVRAVPRRRRAAAVPVGDAQSC